MKHLYAATLGAVLLFLQTAALFAQTGTDTAPPVLYGVPENTSFTRCWEIPPPAEVTALDDVDGPVPVLFSEERTNESMQGSYTLIRTWTATDAAGNTASDSQAIHFWNEYPYVEEISFEQNPFVFD